MMSVKNVNGEGVFIGDDEILIKNWKSIICDNGM